MVALKTLLGRREKEPKCQCKSINIRADLVKKPFFFSCSENVLILLRTVIQF